MHGSLSKYFGTPTDSSGNPLYWGQPGEFPFRGTPPGLLKDDEYEKIPLVYDAKCSLLTMPEEEQRYNEIIDRCANGWWQLRHERFYEDTGTGKLKVFLAWLEVYGETPTSKSAWEAMKNAR